MIGREALARAMRTMRFWWLFAAFFSGLFVWYGGAGPQTKYLVEVGFAPELAAWALGLVGLAGIAGQIVIGHLSDQIGREWAWTLAASGFIFCYLCPLGLQEQPSATLLYLMVAAQGLFGYGLATVYGAIPAELFQGPRFGFGTLSSASILCAASGPWRTGASTTGAAAMRRRFGSRSLSVWSRSPASGSPDRARSAWSRGR